MTGLRIEIRVHCRCPEGGHDAVAFRTATEGLVVGQWVHKLDSEPHSDGRWTILHHVTGLVLPYDFGDPESAMACAQALGAVGEWVEVDPSYDMAAAIKTLISHGGEPYGADGNGERERRNEVAA